MSKYEIYDPDECIGITIKIENEKQRKALKSLKLSELEFEAVKLYDEFSLFSSAERLRAIIPKTFLMFATDDIGELTDRGFTLTIASLKRA